MLTLQYNLKTPTKIIFFCKSTEEKNNSGTCRDHFINTVQIIWQQLIH